MGNQKYAWNVMMKTEKEEKKNRRFEGRVVRCQRNVGGQEGTQRPEKMVDEKRHLKKKGVKTPESYSKFNI